MDSSNLISRLEKWTVIPDVIDSFTPSAEAKITYGSTSLLTGSALRIEGTQEAPEVAWKSADKDALYTLVMVDPDAPKPEEPSMREFVHWIVANIPGSFSAQCQKFLKESTEVLPYTGPAPPEGNHRYIFVLYKQDGKVELKAPSERIKFNLRSFAKENKLGQPFTVQEGRVESLPAPADRKGFKLRAYAKENNLGDPAYADFFFAEKDKPHV